MSPEMITALGAFVLGIGSLLSAIQMNRKTMALLEYRLGKVEQKLDEHNGYGKLFAGTSAEISEIRQDVAVIKTKIEYIEKEK